MVIILCGCAGLSDLQKWILVVFASPVSVKNSAGAIDLLFRGSLRNRKKCISYPDPDYTHIIYLLERTTPVLKALSQSVFLLLNWRQMR